MPVKPIKSQISLHTYTPFIELPFNINTMGKVNILIPNTSYVILILLHM